MLTSEPKEPASLAGDGYYIKVKQEAPGFSGSASTKLFLIRGAPSSDQSTYSNTTALPYTGTITKTVTTTSLASLPQGPITGSATFTGSVLLTGNCNQYIWTSATRSSSALYYPIVGCSNEQPECCPFPIDESLDTGNGLPLLGNLTTCPGDYATTSGACCPK